MYVKSGEQPKMRYKEWRARQRQQPQPPPPPPPGDTSGDPWWTRPDNPQAGDPWWLRRHDWRHRRRGCHRQCHPKLFFATFLICAGAALFFANVGLIAVRDIWAYWPLILVAMGVSHLANDLRPGMKFHPRGFILIIVGIGLLANNFGFFFMAADFAWPILLIILGGFLLVKTLESHRRPQAFAFAPSADAGKQQEESRSFEHILKEQVYFGNLKRTISSQDFRGGELISVFGEINIDLRHAQISNGTSIEANATFGAINIRVPETWRVSVRGAGIFGGYEDKTLPPRPAPGFNPPLLVITGAAVFGAVVVKN